MCRSQMAESWVHKLIVIATICSHIFSGTLPTFFRSSCPTLDLKGVRKLCKKGRHQFMDCFGQTCSRVRHVHNARDIFADWNHHIALKINNCGLQAKWPPHNSWVFPSHESHCARYQEEHFGWRLTATLCFDPEMTGWKISWRWPGRYDSLLELSFVFQLVLSSTSSYRQSHFYSCDRCGGQTLDGLVWISSHQQISKGVYRESTNHQKSISELIINYGKSYQIIINSRSSQKSS